MLAGRQSKHAFVRDDKGFGYVYSKLITVQPSLKWQIQSLECLLQLCRIVDSE